MLGRNFVLRWWWGTGRCSPEKLWIPHTPENVQSQVGWVFEKPGLVEDVCVYGRGVGTKWSFTSLLLKSFGIYMIVQLYDFTYLTAIRFYIKPPMHLISEHIWAGLCVYAVTDSLKTCDKIFSKTKSDIFTSLII